MTKISYYATRILQKKKNAAQTKLFQEQEKNLAQVLPILKTYTCNKLFCNDAKLSCETNLPKSSLKKQKEKKYSLVYKTPYDGGEGIFDEDTKQKLIFPRANFF